MKRFIAGLAAGLAVGSIITSALGASVSEDIRLIINGRDITPSLDVKPQIIEGRVMVPARYVAENLRARVEWDEKGQAVIITSDKTILPGSSELGYLEPLKDVPYHTSEELDEIYRQELEALDLKITYKGTSFVVIDRYTEEILYAISGGDTENLIRAYLKAELKREGIIH
jgi:hypothetical protein